MNENAPHPFLEYSQALLPFHPPCAIEALAAPSLDGTQTERAVKRMLRTLERSDHAPATLVLLGLGDGLFAKAVANAMPPASGLVVVEQDPRLVHGILTHAPQRLDWLAPASGDAKERLLLTDTSLWAITLLLHAFGGIKGCIPLRNPAVSQKSAPGLGALQKMLVTTQEEKLPPFYPTDTAPSLSIAAILRPEEPYLNDFFAQFPDNIGGAQLELAVVWDTATLPDSLPTDRPLRQMARPLNGDFAAQRNTMLSLCNGEWVLFLDADERLPKTFWEVLPAMIARRQTGAYWFPRQTFYPDTEHALSGLGLWPDLQLRLFRRGRGVHFINRVHERLVGVAGNAYIAPALAIRHLNQVQKTAEEIEAKYAVFNAAGELTDKGHRRSKDYPHLSVTFFEEMERRAGADTLLRLPAQPEE